MDRLTQPDRILKMSFAQAVIAYITANLMDAITLTEIAAAIHTLHWLQTVLPNTRTQV